MSGFIISSVVLLILFSFGIYLIYKKELQLSRVFEIVIGFFIIIIYTFSFIERYTNSNFQNLQVQYFLPTYHFGNIVIYTFFITTLISEKYKIKKVLNSICSFLGLFCFSVSIINMVSSMKVFVSFSEASVCVSIAYLLISLYGLYCFVNNTLIRGYKGALISFGFSVVVYSIMLVLNNICGYNFFGMSFLPNKGYLIMNIPLNEPTLSIVINYVFLVGMIVLNYLLSLLINIFKEKNDKKMDTNE